MARKWERSVPDDRCPFCGATLEVRVDKERDIVIAERCPKCQRWRKTYER